MAPNSQKSRPRSQDDAAPVLRSDVQIAKRMAEKRDRPTCALSEGRIWRYSIDTSTLADTWQAIPEDEMRREAAEYDTPDALLNKARIDSILTCFGDQLGDQPDFFAHRVLGINCADGLITFDKKGEPSISGHRPEHRQRHVLPGYWKIGTKGNPPEGSLLAMYLKGAVAGDPEADEKLGLLQEVAGVTALGYATQMVSPKAIVLLGRSAENGKSQYLDMLTGLLPPTAVCSVPPDRLGDDNKLKLLLGALLNVSGELNGAIGRDRFKSAITGDLLDARSAYARNVVQFRPVAQHVYACNQLPPFTGGMDAGVRRRLIVVEFLRTIPKEERVAHIGKRIAHEEADLLLAWAVEGAQRVLAQGHYSELASSKRALTEWTRTANPVAAWIADRVLPPLANVEGKPPRVSSADAFADFRAWHLVNEGQATRMKQARFTQDLQGAGLPGVGYIPGSNGFRGFAGLRLAKQPAAMQAATRTPRWDGAFAA